MQRKPTELQIYANKHVRKMFSMKLDFANNNKLTKNHLISSCVKRIMPTVNGVKYQSW